ncbi:MULTISPECIES: DUF2218 domain-containing protein [Ponticoccus]|uniref:DUF2218 domain-containing protein n=1 Tax=Ponticoccus litoralis TaxID=422297 RepID=A0AAW9SPH1_9RHOB
MAHHEIGRFETPNGSKYLQQLCKHFAHKIAVTYDAEQGTAALPMGPAQLRADPEGLTIEIEADSAEGLPRARAIIDDHLARFAFREDFTTMNWQPAA